MEPEPAPLLRPEQSGIPFRTQFKIAGSVPTKYGIVASFSFQSLPAYRYGTAALNIDPGIVAGPSGQPGLTSLANPNGQGSVWVISKTTTYGNINGQPHPCIGKGTCTAGQLVDPTCLNATCSVPLIAPQTEFGDRIKQLDINVTKTIRIGHKSLQPKFDLFNVLNVAPVYAVRSLNYGTAAYLQPSSVLVGRVFQLGAVLKF